MSEARILRVKGQGRLRLRPDLTRITIHLSRTAFDYEEVVRKTTDDSRALQALLEPLGFGKEDLKTLQFSIDPNYESRMENGLYRQHFIGYRSSHQIKVEFDSGNERLGRILYALGHSSLNPEFYLAYGVKDQEAAKNELLALAVKDAKAKAAILAEAAGVKLGEILSLDYSWGEIAMEVRPFNRNFQADELATDASPKAAYAVDIAPDDIDISDTVTVVWEIG